MRILSFVLLIALFSTGAFAGDRVNSKESLRLCKSAMEADVPEGTMVKFKRGAATSVSSSSFKHWINVVEISGTEKNAKKLRCETSRSGEILVLEIKPGRWRL